MTQPQPQLGHEFRPATKSEPAMVRVHVSHPAAGAEGPSWSLLATGDVFLAEESGRQGIDLDPALAEQFRNADLVLANPEGALARGCSPAPKAGPHLPMHAATLDAISQWGRVVACLANNHVADFGSAGLEQTIEACRARGIEPVGAGRDRVEAFRPVVLQPRPGVSVAVLNLAEWQFGAAEDCRGGHARLLDPALPAALAEARAVADVLIAVIHAGVENVPLPPAPLQDLARGLLGQGVDLVIGHHPHWPQAWETRGGKAVAYSLGNFHFDFPAGRLARDPDWGLVLRCVFAGTQLTALDMIPVLARDRGVAPCPPEQARVAAEYLALGAEIIADRARLEAAWHQTASRVFREVYLPYLRCSLGIRDRTKPPYLSGICTQLRHTARAALNRPPLAPPPSLVDPSQQLLLLHLFRTESHRWTIETALSLMAGETPDRSGPAAADAIEELTRLHSQVTS